MNLLLTIFLSAVSVIGSFLFMKSQLKKAINMSLHGFSSSRMIGGGTEGEASRPRAKILNKSPLMNPAVSNQGMGGINQNRIPDMSGVNNGNLPAVQGGAPAPSMGGGVGVTAVVGLVNGIGAVVQNGNVMNKFAAKRQLMGPVFQGGGMIYNVKPRGVKRLNQTANNMLNAVNRGRVTMKQGAGNRNAIASARRATIRSGGMANNYIYGDVRGIRSRLGNIHTRNLQIKGPSRPKSLFVSRLYAPKAKRIRIQEMLNGGYIGAAPKAKVNYLENGHRRRKRLRLGTPYVVMPALNPGNNINVRLNDVNLQKHNDYNLQRQHFALNKSSNDYLTMVGMSSIVRDPRNQGLSTEQMAKLYTLTRVSEGKRSSNGGYESNELFRQLVSTVPQLSTKDMRKVASDANRLKEARDRNRAALADRLANEKVDINKESMSALNNLLKDTSGPASAHFNNFIEENFKDEINRELSEDEVKEIEQRARENISKRDDIPLEQKEEEFEKEKEKLMEDKKEENAEVIEAIVKERILANPDEAESILGKEGSAALKEQIGSIKEKRDQVAAQEIIRQELSDHSKYLSKHPEQKSASYYDVYKARQQEEMRQDIVTVSGNLYAGDNGNRGGHSLNSRAGNNNPQPKNQGVFVPRQLNERAAGGAG